MEALRQIRSFRIKGFAIFDTSLSLVAGYVLGIYLGYNPILMALVSIPIGEAVHAALGVETEGIKLIKSCCWKK
jgi:hypothetical protein